MFFNKRALCANLAAAQGDNSRDNSKYITVIITICKSTHFGFFPISDLKKYFKNFQYLVKSFFRHEDEGILKFFQRI